MSNLRAAATAEYESLCERLFREWLGRSLSRQSLDRAFSIDHCPEPYLDFQLGDDPLIYVTHNPGRGEPFQLRTAVDTPASPIISRETYRENARRLAGWYSGAGSLKISAAARTRIWAMGSLARQLGARGVRQVETFPLHSDRSAAKQLLATDMRLAGPLGVYRDTCKRYIQTGTVVIAISGSAPDRSGKAANDWAAAIGLNLTEAKYLPLKRSTNGDTVGVFASEGDAGTRALFCCRGSNSLPGKDRMPAVVTFLRGLSK